MSRSIRPLLTGILTAAVVLTGCGTEVSGSSSGAGPANTTAANTAAATPSDPTSSDATSTGDTSSSDISSSDTSSSDTSTSPQAGGSDVQDFVAMIADGMSKVTSYKGKISTDLGSSTSGSMTGTMQGTVKDGKAANSEANISLAAGTQSIEVKLLVVGSKTYVGGSTFLAAVPAAKGKTWILADPNSSNATIKQLAKSLQASSSSSNIESFTKFAAAAKSVQKGGTSDINGVETTQYDVVLDPAKLATAGAAATSGSTAKAVFYVDNNKRMRRAKIDVTQRSVAVVVTLDMTDYNTAVNISAPAASTVYTG